MTNPYTPPSISGYNAVPGTDTGSAGGANNIVSWAKHIDNIGDPLKAYAQAISAAITTAFEGIFGTADVDLIFVQAAAPTGWTQRTNLTDRVLVIVGNEGGQIGTGEMAQTGGATGGTWKISGLTFDQGSLATTNVPTTPNEITVLDDTSLTIDIDSSSSWRPKYVGVIRCYRNFA